MRGDAAEERGRQRIGPGGNVARCEQVKVIRKECSEIERGGLVMWEVLGYHHYGAKIL